MQLVLDTNIVLDLLVFEDPQVRPLSDSLGAGELHWLATAAMREELSREWNRRGRVAATAERSAPLVNIVTPPRDDAVEAPQTLRQKLAAGRFVVSVPVLARRVRDLETFLDALEKSDRFDGVLAAQERTTSEGLIDALIEGVYIQPPRPATPASAA